MLIAMILSGVMVLLELPSGVFADKYGRKLSIILSGIFLVIGAVLLAYGSGFWMFALSMVFMGVSISFQSGADSALVYDSLLAVGKVKEYKRIESTGTALKLAGFGLGGLIGAYLFSINIRLPYYVYVGICVLTLIASFTFEEPKIHRAESTHWKHLGLSFKFIKNQREVKFLILYSALITAFAHISHRFQQPFLASTGLDVKYFGLVYLLILVIPAIIIRYTDLIEERFGERIMLIIIPLLITINFLILGMTKNLLVGIVMLFSFHIASEMLLPIIKTYLNKHVESDMRATVLSVNSFIFHMIFIVFSFFIGWIADIFTFAQGFLALGVLVGITSVITLYIWFNGRTSFTSS